MEYNNPSQLVKHLNFGEDAKSKIIDGVECTCADNLRRLYLTKPRHNQSEIRIKRRIEIGKKKYQKCYND